MISPLDIKKKAGSQFKKYLSSIITDTEFFPLIIRGNKKPSENIAKFQAEIASLVQFSKEKKGFGYSIEFITVNTRNRAKQDLPSSITFDSEEDYLKFIEKEKETINFKNDAKLLLVSYPELEDFVINKPDKIIKQAGKWNSIIKVLDFFKSNPKPNLYIRELPIAVHTKFIEKNKGIIREILDLLLDEVNLITSNKFEIHFNLKYSEPLVRFKILDQNIADISFSGVNDLALPLSHFNRLNLNISKVIIVENKTSLYTTLTLPDMTNTIAVFGQGFGVSNLKNIEWLKTKEIQYWGDFDAHGFEILSQVRGYYPQTKSVLMNKNTFDKFFENDKGAGTKVSQLDNLTEAESKLHRFLLENNYRLEQEKIPNDYVIKHFIL
ncbi:hypothetical protein JCM19296_1185 [Nonlabens ulvanivorans]|uniref:Wadjet protein JetD C-terminal domain-containing protein n=1 Tax=Nonlabens ulvanivorans TaxID=906888 RepID=A0A081D9J7_NONUL|nr:DUF3322 and DUF2220 domain-containing protein [Nonlabens ulvanivorans]GAK75593.1 hypothetical protein JCM19296_1185 [Nonlabens ulvanivorans]